MPATAQKRLAAILAADIVGYSRLMETDEAATYAALRETRAEVVDPLIARHSGRIVKHLGDGFLAEFPTVNAAVACALEMQREMAQRAAETPEDRRLIFRIGINLGDVIVDDEGDIFGDGVNVAARLESLARPGGVCVSGPVFELVRKGLEAVPADLGEQKVKNISARVQAYELLPGDGAGGRRRPGADRRPRRRAWLAVAAMAAVAAAGAWLILWDDPGERAEGGPDGGPAAAGDWWAREFAGLPVLYFDRPPHFTTSEAGDVTGIFADRVAGAFLRAGLAFDWAPRRAEWHLKDLEADPRPLCAAGWFRTPERERIARFTEPFHVDPPPALLTRADNARVLGRRSVAELVADDGVRFGAKQGFDYGGFQALLDAGSASRVTTSRDNFEMLRMLIDGGFDFTVATPGEAEDLVRRAGDLGAEVVALSLPDMPGGDARHILCSFSVPPETIDRLNEAIRGAR